MYTKSSTIIFGRFAGDQALAAWTELLPILHDHYWLCVFHDDRRTVGQKFGRALHNL